MSFEELFGYHNPDGVWYNLYIDRRLAHQLAIALDSYRWRRCDANVLRLGVGDVAYGVDASVEEAAQAEDDVPPMYGSYECEVEQSVVSNGIGQLLHTATIVFTDAHREAE